MAVGKAEIFVGAHRRRGPSRGRFWLFELLSLMLAVPAVGNADQGPAPSRRDREQVATENLPSWTSLGLGGGGAMFSPSISPVDPNLILLSCDMSGIYRSTDGGKNWDLIHYRQLASSTRVRPVWHSADPNIAFAAGGEGGTLKMTRDKGRTWSPVPACPSAVSAIGIDPGRPQLMLVGSRRGIFRSTDAGKNWEQVGEVRGRLLGFHFDQTSAIHSRTCIAATDQIILRSDDGGARWREVAAGFGSGPILAFAGGSNDKSNSCVLYCSVERRVVGGQITGGIYRSLDRGAAWTRANVDREAEQGKEDLPRLMQYEFVVTTDLIPSRVYATRGEDGRVFRSDDRGATWRETLFPSMKSASFNVDPNYLIDEPGVGGDTISGLGINPADPEHVIVVDWMDCFITKNGGKTWASAHTRSAEVAGRRGKGMRWMNTGLVVTTVWNYYLDPFEPNRHYIAYTDIGYARSTDAGKTWYWQTGRPLRNTTYELAFDPDTPGTIWAAFADLHDIPQSNVISGRHYFPQASGGVGASTDFGKTWKDTSQGLPNKPITSVIVDPKSPKASRTLYASAFEAGVYQSSNGGQSWVRMSNGLGAPGTNMRACRIIMHHDGTLFCLVTGLRRDHRFVAPGPGLYRSTDGGKNWTWVNRSRPLFWPKDYDIDPRDSQVIYLGAADADNDEGGLYKTIDGGVNWERIARKDGDCFGATVHPRKPNWVYLCIAEGETSAGLWLSKDAGKTWGALEGMPFRNAQRVTFDPGDDSLIYVSTFGGGVWRGPAE
jgi:photosystem II stability/assembly factor-like uncharacterized protein